MKKTILIGVTTAITLSILAGCGNSNKEAPSKNEDKVAVLNAEETKDEKEKVANSKEIYDYSNKAEGVKDKKDPSLVINKAKDPVANAKKAGVYVDGEKEKILEEVREERDKKQNDQASKDLATKTSGTIEFSDLTIEISDDAEKIMADKAAEEKKSQSYSSEELKPVIEKAEKDFATKLNESSAGRILNKSKTENISIDEALRAYL